MHLNSYFWILAACLSARLTHCRCTGESDATFCHLLEGILEEADPQQRLPNTRPGTNPWLRSLNLTLTLHDTVLVPNIPGAALNKCFQWSGGTLVASRTTAKRRKPADDLGMSNGARATVHPAWYLEKNPGPNFDFFSNERDRVGASF